MAALKYPPCIVSGPENATGAVIFLHGLGDTGHGWADISGQFQGRLQHVRFIFPTAPNRPITLNWGMSMPGWYDIPTLEEINSQEDKEGLMESMRYIEELVQQQVAKGIPSDRIIVGGFSQGGAVALLMLRSTTKLGAVVGLSTYLPLHKEPVVVSDVNKNTPVLMCHGTADQVVRFDFGRTSHTKLTEAGVDADFATYSGMGHSACAAELQDVEDFLAKHLPPQ